jgi:hypothetical protein
LNSGPWIWLGRCSTTWFTLWLHVALWESTNLACFFHPQHCKE